MLLPTIYFLRGEWKAIHEITQRGANYLVSVIKISIVRWYHILCCKGSSTLEKPHRMSCIQSARASWPFINIIRYSDGLMKMLVVDDVAGPTAVVLSQHLSVPALLVAMILGSYEFYSWVLCWQPCGSVEESIWWQVAFFRNTHERALPYHFRSPYILCGKIQTETKLTITLERIVLCNHTSLCEVCVLPS